ncbi:MAG: TraB/GumN family protein, partial [Pseudomonadota bacterium]
TEEEAEMLDETLSEFGLSVSSVGNMRPWFVSIQLAQLALGKAGGDPAAGVEMILGARAAEEGKSQRFFETMSEQIEIIASIPDEVWATSLIEGIDDLSDIEAYFAQMVGLWYDGDAEGLSAFLAEAWDETPELKTTLLDERNERWADALDTLIEEEAGTFFVAVGAGHLAGEGSVQDYLAGHGYETTRVNP